MGGSPCRMSIIRNGNVTLSTLRKRHVAMSILRKCHVTCHLGLNVDFKDPHPHKVQTKSVLLIIMNKLLKCFMGGFRGKVLVFGRTPNCRMNGRMLCVTTW